jgi:hypothetical protein
MIIEGVHEPVKIVLWLIAVAVLAYGGIVSAGCFWAMTCLWVVNLVRGWAALVWGGITLTIGYGLIQAIINHPF